jgi:hypothetical protein
MSEAHIAQITEFFRDLSNDDKHALLTNDELACLAARVLSATEFRPSLLVVRHNGALQGEVLDYARVYLRSGRQLGRTGDAIAVLLLKSAIRDLHEEARTGLKRLRAGLLSAMAGSLAGILIGAINLGFRPISSNTSELVSIAACATTLLIIGASAVLYKNDVEGHATERWLQSNARKLERIAGDIANGAYDSRVVLGRLTEIGRTVECIPLELLQIIQARKTRHFKPCIDQPLVIGPFSDPYSHSIVPGGLDVTS